MSNRLNLTDEQIAEWLPIYEAWLRGKTIQCFDTEQVVAGWSDFLLEKEPPNPARIPIDVKWRVTPKPVEVKQWAVLRANGTFFQVYAEERMAINVCKNLSEGSGIEAYFVVELTGTYTPK